MKDYESVEKKAIEWELSSRHIQYLCRNGKIEGAEKYAGVWFIPSNTPSPAKNSKPHGGLFHYSGTKKKIFFTAIELFQQKGYDNVSLRDIADKVGIRQSTIYNHFHSKQKILDTIYDFFCYYHLKDRPSLAEMDLKLKNATPMDIVQAIRYMFKEDYVQALLEISKIIFQRLSIDSRANEIAKTLMLYDGIEYVETIFDSGVEQGRFAAFDTHSLAVFINCVRIFTFYVWVLDLPTEEMMKFLETEEKLYGFALQLIKDLKPVD